MAFPFPLLGNPGFVELEDDESETENTTKASSEASDLLGPPTGYSQMSNWLDMRLLPGDPPFALSANPALRPIECRALHLLRHCEPPTSTDVLKLFKLIPLSFLRRSSNDGTRYFGVGANPRSSGSLLNMSIDMPFFTMSITKLIAFTCPEFRFSSCIIFRGCKSQPHRDTNNGSDQSLVLQLSPPIAGSGLWVQDPLGDVSLAHKGVPVSGRVVPIDRPYLLNARKLLHAGYLPEGTNQQERVIW